MPILFLDFDRTLFDTEKLYEWLGEDRFGKMAQVVALRIQPPDFGAMLYADTLPFLESAKETHELVLLSYAMNTKFQKLKIDGSGIAHFFTDVIITQKEKGIEVKSYLARKGSTPGAPDHEHLRLDGNVFVDDVPRNVSEMKTTNPRICCIRIDRTRLAWDDFGGVAGEPDYIAQNLDEVLQIIKTEDLRLCHKIT